MRSLLSSGKPRKRKPVIVRRVVGSSMLPKLPGDQVVVGIGYFGRLRVGDVVVINHNELEKVKRVSKQQGDKLFVVGDNLEHSTDSRYFGWLTRNDVVAKVIWPR